MKRIRFILSILLLNVAVSVKAQNAPKSDSLAVMQIIEDVFDGMRAGDSSMISQHLLEGIVMHSVAVGPNGDTKIFTESKPDGWLQAVAQPKEQVWDERTRNFQLHLTQGLATIWMDYAFFIDEQFSHCGVNSFQLVKSMGKWKIIYIIDTRKREECNISDFLGTNN